MHESCMSQNSVFIQIERFEGSSPREVGAWMRVSADGIEGTIGGGHLEFDAIAKARTMLSTQPFAPQVQTHRYALGPSLGQCCGGVVWLRMECFASENAIEMIATTARIHCEKAQKDLKIALFGGGHVGKAIVQALGRLPCQVHWIDSRDEIFPTQLPANVQAEHSAPVQAAVADLAPQSHLLIMSFSHAEDLEVLAACLKRQRERKDLPYIGLIGSKTKWATFRHRLSERGFTEQELAHVTSPIGLPSIAGKEPDVIALGVAAQLMGFRVIQ
jgi:xanthine dehydrogenase accessory factor